MKKATDKEVYEQIKTLREVITNLRNEVYNLEAMLSIDFLDFNIERANFEEFIEKLEEAYKPF